jgi:hypothetical protein
MANSSQRTNLILLAVLALLGVGAAIKAFVLKSDFDTGDTAKASESLFASFKKDEVTALVIDGPEQKHAEIVKDGDHWNLASENNFRADKADVDKVLNGIQKLKCGKEASTKGDQLERFNLQKGKGITVTAYGAGGKSGAPVAEFTIGKSTDDYKFAFLKLPKENSIRKVEGATSDFESGYDNTWRDKNVYDNGDAGKIEQMEVTGPKGVVTLVRGKEEGPKDAPPAPPTPPTDAANTSGDASNPDTTKPDAAKPATKPEKEVKEQFWELEQPTKARAKKWLGDNMANYLNKLDCDSFFTGTEKPSDLGLDPPAYVAKVKREGSNELKPVLLIGNKSKDGKYPVKRPDKDDPTIFWVASWQGDYLTKTADELLETPPKKPDEKKPDDKKTDEAKPDAPKGDAAAANPTPADAPKGDEKKPEDKPADGGKPNDGGAKPNDGGAKPNDGGGGR